MQDDGVVSARVQVIDEEETNMDGIGLGDALQMATRGNDGQLGGSGAWWIVLLFLLLIGGNGLGARSAGGQPVTEAGLCDAMNFNNLENAVGRLSDSQAAIARQTDNGISNLGYETLRNFNTTQAQASEQASALQQQIADCCCTTQRAIDSVNFNAAQNTASINQTTTEQTQKVLDAISQNKVEALQARVNQLELQQATQGVVRYPNGFTYSAGANPFCGGGCGVSF